MNSTLACFHWSGSDAFAGVEIADGRCSGHSNLDGMVSPQVTPIELDEVNLCRVSL